MNWAGLAYYCIQKRRPAGQGNRHNNMNTHRNHITLAGTQYIMTNQSLTRSYVESKPNVYTLHVSESGRTWAVNQFNLRAYIIM